MSKHAVNSQMLAKSVPPSSISAREQKGLQIASAGRIKKKGAVWVVPSQSHPGSYVVDLPVEGQPNCSCPDNEVNTHKCKHIFAVEFSRTREVKTDGTTLVTETMRVTYAQDWPAYNEAQVQEKERFMLLLRSLCEGISQPPQECGRPRLPLADVVFGATMKVYTTISGRRASTDIREAREKGLIDEVPHYNSLFKYVDDPALTPVLKRMIEESAMPLRSVESTFAVDATGFAACTYVRWFDAKYGKMMKEHHWLKAHLMCGVLTNVVTSVEVTEGNKHDSPEFVGLVNSTATRFNVVEIVADKGYTSKKNVAAAAAIGAMPYIPFLSTVKGDRGPELWRKLYGFYQFKRPEFLAHYHKRSNAESTISMIKRKFGPSLRSKKFVAQTNEILLKVLCHNLAVLVHSIFELGIEPTFWKANASAQVESK
jgi:transposase